MAAALRKAGEAVARLLGPGFREIARAMDEFLCATWAAYVDIGVALNRALFPSRRTKTRAPTGWLFRQFDDPPLLAVDAEWRGY